MFSPAAECQWRMKASADRSLVPPDIDQCVTVQQPTGLSAAKMAAPTAIHAGPYAGK